MKKKTLVPLIIFLLGICLVGFIVYKTDTHEKNARHITAQLNATTYGERIKNEIASGIEITDALKQILISENGEINQFDTIAENLMSASIESVQLAPDGVVTDIYPAEGNEAGKIDLIHDKDRGEISCYARDNHTVITQGPFELKQGDYGIAVRNPVYLTDTNKQEYFWGFTIVILRVPDIFSDSIYALSNFDIDDFKFINDVYGHAYGDRALKSLTDSMKAFFPPNVLLGRNGGDEFCILLPDYTFEEADAKLNQFTRLPKTFSYKGTEHHFSISLGYAEYPAFASNHSQLMRCADAALYEIKLHGKNGCMAYREDLQSGVRKQLGFALKDVSEHLPGAFIIYRADKEDDELFYANQEFLHMTGYKDMGELFRLTNKSFHNLIREDEQKQIEASIWEQIDSGNENDYIHFHLRKADGSYLSVLDHGRIVENQQYGRVFYVLFMDWKDMHIHYGDKFSG